MHLEEGGTYHEAGFLAAGIVNGHAAWARNHAQTEINQALLDARSRLSGQAIAADQPTSSPQQSQPPANQQQPTHHELVAVENFAEETRGRNGSNVLRSKHILNAMIDLAREAIKVIDIERDAGRSILSTDVITTLLSIQNELSKGKIAAIIGYSGFFSSLLLSPGLYALGGINEITATVSSLVSASVFVGGFWWEAKTREDIANKIHNLHQWLNSAATQQTPVFQQTPPSSP